MTDFRDAVRRRVELRADPAAGANLSVTVPGHETWVVESFVFRLVTAIAVATRIVEVLADDQRDVYLRVPAREGQAASLTRFYSAFAGNAAPATGAPTIGVPWPSEGLVLPPGHRLRTLVDALQATDQISQVVLSVLAYPVGPAVQPIPDADAVWEPLVGINPLNAPPPYR